MTLANPFETIEPTTTYDALRDTTRYMATFLPRANVVDFVTDMNPERYSMAMRDGLTDPPLTGYELMFANTLDHYGRQFGETALSSGAVIAVLQDNMRSDEVFIGNPLPTQHYVDKFFESNGLAKWVIFGVDSGKLYGHGDGGIPDDEMHDQLEEDYGEKVQVYSRPIDTSPEPVNIPDSKARDSEEDWE